MEIYYLMEVKDIPIQAVVAIAAVILAFLQATLIFLFTRFLNDVKELKTEIKSMEEKKVGIDTMELKFQLIQQTLTAILNGQNQIRQDLSGFATRIDTRLRDHDRQIAELKSK